MTSRPSTARSVSTEVLSANSSKDSKLAQLKQLRLKHGGRENLKETIKLLLIVAIPLIFLLTVTSVLLSSKSSLYTEFTAAQKNVEESFIITPLLESLMEELRMTLVSIADKNQENILKTKLEQAKLKTDESVKNVLANIHFFDDISLYVIHLRDTVTLYNLSKVLSDHRKKVRAKTVTTEDNLFFYANLTEGYFIDLFHVEVLPSVEEVWKIYMSLVSLVSWNTREQLHGAIIASYFPTCNLSSEMVTRLMQEEGMIDVARAFIFTYYHKFESSYDKKIKTVKGFSYVKDINAQVLNQSYDAICKAKSDQERTTEAVKYIENHNHYIKFLEDMEKETIKDLVNFFSNSKRDIDVQFIVAILFSAMIFCFSITLAVWYTYHINKLMYRLHSFTKDLIFKTKSVKKEKKKAEDLLYSVMPQSIAGTLIYILSFCVYGVFRK